MKTTIKKYYNMFVSTLKKNLKVRNFDEVVVASLTILAILFGLYMAIGWALIGGIMNVVTGFTADPVSAYLVAIGAVKVFFFQVIGVISGGIAWFFGYLFAALLDKVRGK